MRIAGPIVVAAVAAAVACGGGPERQPAPGGVDEAAPVVVESVAVERGSGPALSPVPAQIVARDSATLAARTSAAVTELPVREGQRVSRGTVVARLDDRALRAAETAAETAVAAAEADAKRLEALHERDAATPQELEGARSRAASARAGLAAAREARAYAVLEAPFDGRVARRPADVGDVVGPGEPLLVIEGEALELVASVDAAQVARLAAGQEWTARVDGRQEPVPVRLRSIAPSGDPGTHRFEVRGDVPRLEGLRAGVFARLLLRAEAEAEAEGEPVALQVPASAVFERGGLVGVYVIHEGRARLRWIAAGRRSAGALEVRAGLSEGERVAVTPAGLSDGRATREPS